MLYHLQQTLTCSYAFGVHLDAKIVGEGYSGHQTKVDLLLVNAGEDGAA